MSFLIVCSLKPDIFVKVLDFRDDIQTDASCNCPRRKKVKKG